MFSSSRPGDASATKPTSRANLPLGALWRNPAPPMRFPGFAREPSPRRKIALLLVAAAALPLSATLWVAVRQARALAWKAAIDRLERRPDQVAERLDALDGEYRRPVGRVDAAQELTGAVVQTHTPAPPPDEIRDR